jgi:hypothetical protein
MSGINTTRVLIGGLAAGVVLDVGESLLNTVVLGSQMTETMAKMNLAPPGGSAIGVFILLGFALGIATVWLYAAIRPRFGAGMKTALIAGAVVWFMAYLYGGVGLAVMGIFPTGMMAFGLVWGLVEVMVAAVVGGMLYREP